MTWAVGPMVGYRYHPQADPTNIEHGIKLCVQMDVFKFKTLLSKIKTHFMFIFSFCSNFPLWTTFLVFFCLSPIMQGCESRHQGHTDQACAHNLMHYILSCIPIQKQNQNNLIPYSANVFDFRLLFSTKQKHPSFERCTQPDTALWCSDHTKKTFFLRFWKNLIQF